ncbi:MAG TPA: retroviral-like aspartic protease family protein [Burkholderiaceae bacterium]
MSSRFLKPAAARLLAVFVVLFSCALPAHAVEYTSEDYKKAVGVCMKVSDLECAQKNWIQYLRLRPNDTAAITNLGLLMSLRDNQKGAIVQYERAIELGEGAYNLFAYYADSLGDVGRTDEAIDWSYKTLSIMPNLVDVRTKLAKYLLIKKRYYEALALLEAYDDRALATGIPLYFQGQRIAIESTLERNGGFSAVEAQSLRLPKYDRFFYAPVSLGNGKPAAFILDTGADRMAVNQAFLDASKAKYKVVREAMIVNADRHRVPAKALLIESVHVGPFELKNVSAVSCASCQLLMGQSVISKFNMQTTKVQGVEFVTLAPR